jgi:ArsR family transcriptional regulator, arsenate/arsenite/antimonite-responsive transcriptional repressor
VAANTLVRDIPFDYSINMETTGAVDALAALAQSSRLALYRLLVQAGLEGISAGALSERLEIPAPTLSFHLKALSRAGLIDDRREGRNIFYTANYAQMNALVDFLTDNCCGGRSCKPLTAPARRRSAS